MRLGFYYHIPARQNSSNSIEVPGYLGRWLDELAKHVDKLVLFLHLPNIDEQAHFDYTLDGTNIRLVSLPPRGSATGRLLSWGKFKKLILENRQGIDRILVRAPSPLTPWVARLWQPADRIFLLVGDYVEGVNSLPQPIWRRELIRLFACWNEWEQTRAGRGAIVFANSAVLIRKYQAQLERLFETRTTTLSQADFYLRKDTCLTKPIRLIYTGRVDPAKGLMDIANAVTALAGDGLDLTFEIAGWVDNDSGILAQLHDYFMDNQMPERFTYLGYKAVGPELFECYKRADIFVLASRSSFEGFPRAIWEAMAHGLPVVATDVGSIDAFTQGVAYLAQPGDIGTIRNMILQVIHDPEMRKTRIEKGYGLSADATLETQVSKMMDIILDGEE